MQDTGKEDVFTSSNNEQPANGKITTEHDQIPFFFQIESTYTYLRPDEANAPREIELSLSVKADFDNEENFENFPEKKTLSPLIDRHFRELHVFLKNSKLQKRSVTRIKLDFDISHLEIPLTQIFAELVLLLVKVGPDLKELSFSCYIDTVVNEDEIDQSMRNFHGGLWMFAVGFPRLSHLQKLHIQFIRPRSEFYEDGDYSALHIVRFLEALPQKDRLKELELDLDDVYFTDESEVRFENFMAELSTLKALTIKGNYIRRTLLSNWGQAQEYDLALMSSLPNRDEARFGIIYLSPHGDFVVRVSPKKVHEGRLKPRKFIENLSSKLDDPIFKADVIKGISHHLKWNRIACLESLELDLNTCGYMDLQFLTNISHTAPLQRLKVTLQHTLTEATEEQINDMRNIFLEVFKRAPSLSLEIGGNDFLKLDLSALIGVVVNNRKLHEFIINDEATPEINEDINSQVLTALSVRMPSSLRHARMPSLLHVDILNLNPERLNPEINEMLHRVEGASHRVDHARGFLINWTPDVYGVSNTTDQQVNFECAMFYFFIVISFCKLEVSSYSNLSSNAFLRNIFWMFPSSENYDRSPRDLPTAIQNEVTRYLTYRDLRQCFFAIKGLQRILPETCEQDVQAMAL